METVNGLMFTRNVGNKTILLAVIDNNGSLQNETMHTFTGKIVDGRLLLGMTGERLDITEISRGNDTDGLLTSSIWRT